MEDHIQQLTFYIQSQLQSGLHPDEISNQLRSVGWQDEQIHQAFIAVQQAMMPSHFVAAPAPAQQYVQVEQATQAQPQHPEVATVVPEATGRRRSRITTGWLLLKQSAHVLMGNRYLLRYLIMTGVWTLGLTLFFIGVYVVYIFALVGTAYSRPIDALFYVLAFLNYLLVYYFINLYAAGLAVNILDIFKGQRREYREYMHVARSKGWPIFVFSFFSATIGMFLQFIVERIRWVGWILAWLFGTIWSLGTMFVLPIIVESDSPKATRAIGQSIKFFKHTWGENVVSKIGVNAPLALINLALSFGFLFLFYGAILSRNVVFFLIVLFVWVMVVTTVGIIGSFANSLINVSLYYYAAYRKVPPAFSADMLNQVFIKRKRRLFKKVAG